MAGKTGIQIQASILITPLVYLTGTEWVTANHL